MKNFIKKPIKNLDITYDNELDEVSYEDYYFNNIPILEDIKYEKKGKQLLLTWNINELLLMTLKIIKIFFLSSDIFKLKNDDNTNKKNNIFSEIPNQTKSIFGLLDNKIQNPFLNNDSPEKKLFSSNIEKNKQESLFVNNNNNLKTEILGNSNKEQKEENNIKESLFKFDNIFQKKSLFGNINNEKEEINAKKNSIFGIIFNSENSY